MPNNNSLVTDIIAADDLKPGDPIKSKGGVTIPESVVLSANSCLYRDGEVYQLMGHSPLTDEGYNIMLPASAVAAIRGTTF